MTTEEKAKAYDKAREKIASRFGSNVADEIFSQFEMSEDERIRKVLVGFFKSYKEQGTCGAETFNGIPTENILAWIKKQGQTFTKKDVDDAYLKGVCDTKHELEKQCEQKSTWSEEDKGVLLESISVLQSSSHWVLADKLKSLKDRVGCEANCTTTKQWSEEDERIRKSLIASLSRISADTRTDSTSVNYIFTQEIEWLKSLRHRNTWKPSDEQMERLKGIINSLPHQEVLYSLYQDLLKLKE